MDLLHQRAPTAVRDLLLVLLQKAAQCADRLTDSADSEALHDFRVALRRLNANQRAYRASLGVKLGKGVRRLARATNVARDREVQLDWLRLQVKESAAQARAELAALIAKLERAHEDEREHTYPQWQSAFAEVEVKLRRRLDDVPADDAAQEGFAAVAGTQLQMLGDELKQGFAAIEASGDDAAVHATRITGKRLRYLLEPLAGAVPGVPLLIKRMKALQDLLGEIHDCQVRLDDFAGRRQADRVDQYAALQHDTAARRAQLLAELQTHWLGEQADALFKALQRVIARLDKHM
jgi:CHAD domain-containing protein